MKQMRFTILVVIFCFLSTTTIAQAGPSDSITAKNASSSLSGAWHSVDNKEFLLMSDAFYSMIAKDSTGNWAETHAGTYTIDYANTITLKVTHSSFAYRIGYLHTIEYNLNGDNLTFRLYKKLIDPKAGDVTARVPKGKQTLYVRAKQ